MVRELEDPPKRGLGGNGAAAAYVMGKLGVSVALNAPIGDDDSGHLVRRWLDEANVAVAVEPESSTMFTVTAIDAASNRLGCLQHPSPLINWMHAAENDPATWMLIAAHSLIPANALQEVGEALGFFQSRGGTTVLDTGIGWMQSNDAEEMQRVWATVDLLVGTRDELCFWSGLEEPEAIGARAMACGAGRVVIKMGAEGAAWMSETEGYEHQPAHPITQSNVSVGAGDGFNGALIASLAKGASMESAIALAQSIAAKIVELGNGVIGWGRRSETLTESA